MANIKLNFSSQWSSVQVAKVIVSPHVIGETAGFPYFKKIKHGMKYPPLAIGFRNNLASTSYSSAMEGVDIDDKYVYIRDYEGFGKDVLSYIVIYALDISKNYDYSEYTSEVGTVLKDTSTNRADLRKFLLHSRAVSPMVLSVKTKNYTASDLSLTYTHQLGYPIFNFGYVRFNINGTYNPGIWQNAPLQSQAYPMLQTDGITSTLTSTIYGGVPDSDIGSIITMRNPAIITESSVSVTL